MVLSFLCYSIIIIIELWSLPQRSFYTLQVNSLKIDGSMRVMVKNLPEDGSMREISDCGDIDCCD